MKITRSRELKRPTLDSVTNMRVPKGDWDAAQTVSAAYTTLERATAMLGAILDDFATAREALEPNRENYRPEKFAEAHAALMAKFQPKVAAARREMFAARDAMRETIADATNLARRETDAITADPDKAIRAEKMFGYVRRDQLVLVAERAVRDGALVDGAALRQLVNTDTKIPKEIREKVNETLATMGQQLAAFGSAAARVAVDAVTQLRVHEANVVAWPALADSTVMLRLANVATLESEADETLSPFDRAADQVAKLSLQQSPPHAA